MISITNFLDATISAKLLFGLNDKKIRKIKISEIGKINVPEKGKYKKEKIGRINKRIKP